MVLGKRSRDESISIMHPRTPSPASRAVKKPKVLLFVLGRPGAGKSTCVRSAFDLDHDGQNWSAVALPTKAAWLESSDGAVMLLGRYGGFHKNGVGKNRGSTADGCDRLHNGTTNTPMKEAIASFAASPQTRLVVAEGVCGSVLNKPFVEEATRLGFDVRFRGEFGRTLSTSHALSRRGTLPSHHLGLAAVQCSTHPKTNASGVSRRATTAATSPRS